jgi:hypothetical protein
MKSKKVKLEMCKYTGAVLSATVTPISLRTANSVQTNPKPLLLTYSFFSATTLVNSLA